MNTKSIQRFNNLRDHLRSLFGYRVEMHANGGITIIDPKLGVSGSRFVLSYRDVQSAADAYAHCLPVSLVRG